MSTPTESETSESKTRTRACVALYAVASDQVDPVNRDEYLARHIRYLEELHQAGQVLLGGSFTDWATRSMDSPFSPRPTKTRCRSSWTRIRLWDRY